MKNNYIEIPNQHDNQTMNIPVDVIEEYSYRIKSVDMYGLNSFDRGIRYSRDYNVDKYKTNKLDPYHRKLYLYEFPELTITRKAIKGEINGGSIHHPWTGKSIGWSLHGKTNELYSIILVGKLAKDVYEYLQSINNVKSFK